VTGGGVVPEIVQRLRVDGWCVVPGVVPDAEVRGLREAVVEQAEKQDAEWQAYCETYRASGQPMPPRGVGHAQALASHIPVVARYAADPRIVDAATALFGPPVRVVSTGGLVNYPGNERGYWHSDWPYNRTLLTYVAAPYPVTPMQLSAIAMLTEFTPDNGGTLVVPGSHLRPDNPTWDNGVDRHAAHPDEMQVTGSSGDVLLYDSRLWHAVAPNRTEETRVAVTIRYAPWWLNLDVRRPGSPEHRLATAGAAGKDNVMPLIPRHVFDQFEGFARPLFAHWVDD
jgi:hypothetical protein